MKYGEGFLLVYSIESRQSFNELEIFYQQILRMKDSVSFPMIIVGTKCDLEFQRQVPSSGPSTSVPCVSKLILFPFLSSSQRHEISLGD